MRDSIKSSVCEATQVACVEQVDAINIGADIVIHDLRPCYFEEARGRIPDPNAMTILC